VLGIAHEHFVIKNEGNFAIKKEIFNRLRFDENITNYGYEDVVFGLEAKKLGLRLISINNKVLNEKQITQFKNYPNKNEINNLYSILLKNNFSKSIKHTNSMMKEKHYAMMDILTELTYCLNDSIINNNICIKRGANIIAKLRDIEMNLIITSDSEIQMLNIISVFHNSL
jgi:hypothetical protein